jgi:hypothetical protein
MTSYISLWQRQYGDINNNIAVGCRHAYDISYFSYHRPLLNKLVALLWKYCNEKKYNIYCLDVVTSISGMIRMIKTTLFFSFCVLKCLVANIALLKVKVRFPGTHHEGVWLSGGLAPLLLNLSTTWDELYTLVTIPRYLLSRHLGGQQPVWTFDHKVHILPPPRIETRFVRPTLSSEKKCV